MIIEQYRANRTGQRVMLILWAVLAMCGTQVAAQTSCFSGYAQRDTVTFEVPLGECSVSDAQILSRLGLGGCPTASLSVRRVGVNDTRTVDVYDESTQTIADVIVVKTTVVPAQVPSIVRLQFGTNDCSFSKDSLLNQLNVVDDPAIRSNIHFISGTARLTSFPYGDTIRVDRIVCGEGYTYARDIKIIIEPAVARLQGNVIVHNIGFTTQQATIEEVLRGYQYFHYNCDFSRFQIENRGPFGYGRHRIGDIYIDDALIAKDLEVVVNAGTCPTHLRDLVLEEGQCYLNKADILDTLGFVSTRDDYSRVETVLFTGQSYEDDAFTITEIRVDGIPVCTQSLYVNYQRGASLADDASFACNDELNISLDKECQVMLNSHIILESGDHCYLNYVLTATTLSGEVVAQGHTIVLDRVGRYKVNIVNPKNQKNCWGYVNIEDKFIYDVKCRPDTVKCENSILPSTDGLGPEFPFVGVPSTFQKTSIPGRYIVNNSQTCAIKNAEYIDVELSKCVGGYKEVINRIWTFSDEAGNIDTCHQHIYVEKTPLDSVDNFKPFRTDCFDDFTLLDGNGHPSPEETGYPTVNGGKYPAGICHTLKMSYSDNTFPLCGKSVKIVRDWTIIDWCTDVVDHKPQTIYIEDKRAPELIDTITDLHLDSHPFLCGAENVLLPSPNYTDCGSDAVLVEISYEVFENNVRSAVSNGSSLTIPSVKIEGAEGSFDVYYRLTDECGNVARDTMTVYITDNQPPVAVCDQNTSISIAGGGEAQVKALTFDDLSVDNCGIAKYEARKMSGECYVDTAFTEILIFCCEEVGKKIGVEFRVTDLAGNTNTCEVYVEVFDKFKPIISCPGPITIDCAEDYTNTAITGQADAIDNCTIDSLYYIDDILLNDCGHGTVRRTWIAQDIAGQTDECVQIITVRSSQPFEMTDDMYPPDTTIIGCMATIGPEFTGRPNIGGANACSDVLVTYKDTPFNDVNGACFKIIREWIVIDWCQYSTSSGSNIGKWVKPQAIKVHNTEAPSFDAMPSDTTLCSYGANCDGDISLEGVATDDCSAADELTWFYEVFDQGDNLLTTGASMTARATLSEGFYKIRYTVTDGCGNTARHITNVTVVDCLEPDIDCPDVVLSAILDDAGVAVFNIDDVAVTAFDNCTPSSDIAFSFERDSIVKDINFDCSHVEDGVSQDHLVSIYASDRQGNTSECQVVIKVSDGPNDVCQDQVMTPSDTLQVAGTIMTQEDASVGEVQVYITGPNGQSKLYTTNRDGYFTFDELDRNADYEISFKRNINPTSGVSVLDILQISRHVLGIQPFTSAYNVIAADTDNNGKVSARDISSIKRLLLGKDLEFGNGQESWRFVRADHQFTQIYDPFPYPETIKLSDIRSNQMGLNMRAVKIGDVNGNNEVSSKTKANTRSNAIAHLSWGDSGDDFVPVYGDMTELSAIQLELDDVMDIREGQLSITADDYHYADGIMRLCWYDAEGVSIDADEPLFFVKRANANAPVSGMAVTVDGEAMDVSWGKREEILAINAIDVRAITPNPFSAETTIHIDASIDQEVQMNVFALDGRRIHTMRRAITQGRTAIQLDSEALTSHYGMLLLQVVTDEQTITRRLVRVR